MSANASTETPPTGRLHTFGLVFPPHRGLYSPMALAFVGRVAEAAQAYDYDVTLTAGAKADHGSFQRLLTGNRVDGVILMEVRLNDSRVDYLTDVGFPFICIGRPSQEPSWWVDLDFVFLGRNCVRHLADLGHRRIVFVNRSEYLYETGYESAHRGLAGYNEAMTGLGLTGRNYFCGDNVASGEAVIAQILRDDPGTTAVVTLNEASLGGLYRGLTRAGRVVPRDFSVVMLTAGPWAETATPPVTATTEPVAEICREGVQLLLEQLDSPDARPRHVLLRPLINVRGSTGPCRPVPGTDA